MTASETRKTIRIGVFLLPDTQFLDLACVDVLGSMSYEYMTLVKDLVPFPILNIAPSIQISCM